MKRKKVCTWLLALALVVAAGIFCYYWFFVKSPDEVQGGTLVYERHIIHPDGQEC